jgi:ferrous iron transport protein B
VWEKTWSYLKRAGTVILAASVIIWVIMTFPVYEPSGPEPAELAAREALSKSFAGRMGHFIEPVFRPLGFDWKLAVASLTGFAAKEVIVSTLGVLYSVKADEDVGLRDSIRGDPNMNGLVAFVFMLFTLIIPPCFAALATIKAELGAKWLCFELVFLFILGWVICFIVYQAGRVVLLT